MANVSILGTAQTFAVLGATTVTNTGATALFGDVGVSPGNAITGFPPGVVTGGTIHAGDGVATQAHADLATAYTAIAGEAATTILAGPLDGLTLLPGVYRINTAASLTGTLTLDAQGDPNASFDFLIGTTLITSNNSAVNLINGARGDNVFFQVGSSATLGANTAFAGNILANTSVTLTTGASIAEGRALAVNAAVTLDTNAVSIPPPALTIDDLAVNEAAGTAVFTVSLSRPSGVPISVTATTADGTAVAPGDYTATTTVLNFAAGVVTQTFTVPIINDALNEAPENFTANLSGAVNATVARPVGVATILDDDAPPALAIDNVTVNEAAGSATFTVTLGAASGQVVAVDFATTPQTATAPADYQSVAGTLTFLPGGPLTQTITVPIVNDAIYENTETFLVNLSGPVNATIANAVGVGTIQDDDPLPTISITGSTVTEGNVGTTPAVFTVTLSGLSSFPTTVQYVTANGTATAGLDYLATTGTLTIPAGSLVGTIVVPVVGDLLDEPDETFTVNLSAPTNAALAVAQGVGVILDDDAAPTAAIGPATVIEGNTGTTNATFTVTLSAVSGRDVTVNFATADGTATAGLDYLATAGTLTIPAGSLVGTIVVPVVGDLLDEPDETFTVNLAAPVNATLGVAQGLGTILDDDAAPTASIGGATVLEGNAGTTNATFTVTLSGPSGRTITIDFGTADGTAVGGLDYTPTGGTLTFLPGQTVQTVTVPVLGDQLLEGNETFVVNLANATAATITGAQGLGTILDDDAAPVSVNDTFTTPPSTPLTTPAPGILTNDQAPAGTPLTAVLVSGTASGTVNLDPNGSFTYTPNPGFVGTDQFTYRAVGGGNASNVATATIVVQDIPVPVAPTLIRFGYHASRTFLVLTFGTDLDPARAGALANYHLTGANGKPIALTSAVYDAATRTVTLLPARSLPLNARYRLVVNGSAPAGVTDTAGTLIDGNRDGLPGGDTTLDFGREALRALATNRKQTALAQRFDVPLTGETGLPRQLVARMSSPRFLRLLASRGR